MCHHNLVEDQQEVFLCRRLTKPAHPLMRNRERNHNHLTTTNTQCILADDAQGLTFYVYGATPDVRT